MKTLLIITSIILLSFQINRLFLNNTDGHLIASEVKILDTDFIAKEDLPVIDSTYRSAKVLTKANNSVAVVTKTETSNATKTVNTKNSTKAYYATTRNNNCKMLHRFIKETHNYISFTTVHFNFNQHEELNSKQFNEILQYADKLIFDSTLRVSIAGFADSKGNVEYNEQISWLRANDIKSYMIELGVKENQIMLSANGIADPVAANTSEEGRAMNRRVELALLQ